LSVKHHENIVSTFSHSFFLKKISVIFWHIRALQSIIFNNSFYFTSCIALWIYN